MGCKPLFEGLVEAFNFALGLEMSGSTVFLLYSAVEQFCFECVVGVFCEGGEHESVVCQRGCGFSMFADGVAEFVEDYFSCDACVGCCAQQVPGMVIKPEEYFGVRSIC